MLADPLRERDNKLLAEKAALENTLQETKTKLDEVDCVSLFHASKIRALETERAEIRAALNEFPKMTLVGQTPDKNLWTSPRGPAGPQEQAGESINLMGAQS